MADAVSLTTATPKVVCIGLATLDAIVEVERHPTPDERLPAQSGALAGGGVAATAAVTLARLGVPVAFAGCVGDDAAGDVIRDGLIAAGVDATHLRTARGGSPFTVVLVERGSGARSLVPAAGVATGVEVDDPLAATCASAQWLHVDHVGYAALARLRRSGVTTHVSIDGGNPIDDLSLDGVELYAPTYAQLAARYPSLALEPAIRLALDEGAQRVVVTRGAAGAIGATRSGAGVTFEAVRAPRVEARSTLGAGDVFHGALLAGLVEGLGFRDAIVLASAAAALSCRALDGRSAIPTRAELDAFLAGDRVAAV